MPRQLGRGGFAALAGTMVVAGPVLAGCNFGGPSYDEWAATDGAAGRINLDEVQEAFKKSTDPSEFERRVNEIYEGDGLVLIRASQDGESLNLAGFEDLDSNGVIDDSTDDLLFSIVKEHDNHELRGHGANGYYRQGFGGGDFLFTYLIISSLTRGPYYYQTPPGRAPTMRSNQARYRSSSAYRSQVSKNTSYFGRQKSFAGSRYDSAGRNLSTSRQSYQATQKRTGSFKTASRTGVRSSWGSKGSGASFGKSTGRFGGFSGGGGRQSIVGPGTGRASSRRAGRR